jgi:hypothetical protein
VSENMSKNWSLTGRSESLQSPIMTDIGRLCIWSCRKGRNATDGISRRRRHGRLLPPTLDAVEDAIGALGRKLGLAIGGGLQKGEPLALEMVHPF